MLLTVARQTVRLPQLQRIQPKRSPWRTYVDLTRAREAWNGRLVLSEEVEDGLQRGEPIVALESTIITHGMPQPTNLITALSLESILRDKGVIPATIALLDGKVHIGLSNTQLSRLADVSSDEIKVKVSRRDIAPVLAQKLVGGTTVAGTMVIANSVGIEMFVTGGIGGVHRGAENSMDISADLIELGRTVGGYSGPMAVVCAGAKSILDIPRTFEVLETQGVCVSTYGSTADFPAFYTAKSGLKSPWTVHDPSSAANLIHSSLNLPQAQSTLLAVPIPSDYEERGQIVQAAVEQAVRESVEQGIDKRGKEVTPWLLRRVGELTSGTALELNVRLVENNARVGADVAVELARKQRNTQTETMFSSYFANLTATRPNLPSSSDKRLTFPVVPSVLPSPSVLVLGSAAMDFTSSSSERISRHSTTPGRMHLSPGGVGRNIAEAAQNLLPRSSVQLLSVLGRNEQGIDPVGKLLMMEMNSADLRTDGMMEVEDGRTAACSLVLDEDRDLVAGVADMHVVEFLTPDMIQTAIEKHVPKIIVFDCNSKQEVIERLLETALRLDIVTFCDPTSIPKLHRLIPSLLARTARTPFCIPPLSHFSPNLIELDAFDIALNTRGISDASTSCARDFTDCLQLNVKWRSMVREFTKHPDRHWMRETNVIQKMARCLPFVGSIWTKAGSNGVVRMHTSDTKPKEEEGTIIHTPKKKGMLYMKDEGYVVVTHYPTISIPANEIVSTTGAGDTLVGGLVAGLVDGKGEERDWVNVALQGVERTMRSRRAVG